LILFHLLLPGLAAGAHACDGVPPRGVLT